MRVLLFLGFLASYLGVAVGGMLEARLLLKDARRLTTGRILLMSQVSLVTGAVAFLGSLFLLAGFFNLTFGVLLVLGSEVGVIIPAILYMFIGRSREELLGKSYAARIWLQSQFFSTHLIAASVVSALSVMALATYFIITGIIFFSHPRPSAELTRLVFTSAAAFVAAFFPLNSVQTLNLFLSEGLEEKIRDGALVDSTAAMVPTGLYLSLLLSGTSLTGPGIIVIQTPIRLVASPLIIGVLIAVYLVMVALPFAIGSRRGKLWRQEMARKKAESTSKIIDVLQLPSEGTYLKEIGRLRQDVQTEIDQLRPKPGSFDEEGTSPSDQDDIRLMFDIHITATDIDVTRRYLRWLGQLATEVDQVKEQMHAARSKTQLRRVADSWITYYKDRREQLGAEEASTSQEKSSLAPVWGTLASPVVAAFLGAFGKWLWDIVQHSYLR